MEGNELADTEAGAGAIEGIEKQGKATLANMKGRAKEKALEKWVGEWKERKRGPGVGTKGFGVADWFPPKLIPQVHLTEIVNRRTYGLVTQCRTGHAFIGEYYNRFVPDEPTECPCDSSDHLQFQSRKHILLECPRYDEHRHILAKVSLAMKVGDILGTKQGIKTLAHFIRRSGAFTKTGETIYVKEGEVIYGEKEKEKDDEEEGG